MNLRAAATRNSVWLGPAAVAAVASVLVLAQLDAVGDHPRAPIGPGMTVDEAFDAGQGVQLVDRLLAGDLSGFRRIDAQLPDHPPLGRIWIGLCHELAFLLWPPVDTQIPYSVACARCGPALAFAAVVFLVGWFAGRWYGPLVGAAAAASVVLMPRTFGHAHLAALESCINLTYAAVVLYLTDRWGVTESGKRKAESGTVEMGPADKEHGAAPGMRTAAIGGLLFGLALLTKVQAILLPIPIALWALFVLRRRAVALGIVWGVVGGVVFLAGWPYLWSDALGHLGTYLGRTTERATIYVWYGGKALADRDVPWHYPWVLFATTVPVALHLLGLAGVAESLRSRDERRRALLPLACLTFPLFLFSVPGIAVYDGERLFSVSYPLWGLFIGRGADWLRHRLAARTSPRWALAGVTVLLATGCHGLAMMSPCWLSYYNLATGGLRGAERLGLPVSYWGDGVTRDLLDEVASHAPPGTAIAVAPVLHAHQWDELSAQCPVLRERGIRLIPLGAPGSEKCELILLFRRREYLPEEFRGPLDPARVVAAVRRDGVTLAALVRAH